LNEPFGALRRVLTNLPQEGLARVTAALELRIDTGRLGDLRPLGWTMLAEMQRGPRHGGLAAPTPAHAQGAGSPETAGARQDLGDSGPPSSTSRIPTGRSAPRRSGGGAGGLPLRVHDLPPPRPAPSAADDSRCVLWENSCLDTGGRFSAAVASCVTSGIFHFASGCRHRHGMAPRPAAPTVLR
jgi:hypothetical protein